MIRKHPVACIFFKAVPSYSVSSPFLGWSHLLAMEIWGEIDSEMAMVPKRVEEAECRLRGAHIPDAAGYQSTPISKTWSLVHEGCSIKRPEAGPFIKNRD